MWSFGNWPHQGRRRHGGQGPRLITGRVLALRHVEVRAAALRRCRAARAPLQPAQRQPLCDPCHALEACLMSLCP